MKIYGGFNKCPKCGAIKRSKRAKKTSDLCPNCLKRQEEKEIDMEATLLMIVAFLNRAKACLQPGSGNMNAAKAWLGAAAKDLEEVINTIQL